VVYISPFPPVFGFHFLGGSLTGRSAFCSTVGLFIYIGMHCNARDSIPENWHHRYDVANTGMFSIKTTQKDLYCLSSSSGHQLSQGLGGSSRCILLADHSLELVEGVSFALCSVLLPLPPPRGIAGRFSDAKTFANRWRFTDLRLDSAACAAKRPKKVEVRRTLNKVPNRRTSSPLARYCIDCGMPNGCALRTADL
jgi:hypothetical protein